MKETGGPVLHEVVSGSDTSLRDKVEQMYRKAGSVKQPEGTWWAPLDEEFDRCWAQQRRLLLARSNVETRRIMAGCRPNAGWPPRRRPRLAKVVLQLAHHRPTRLRHRFQSK